MISQSFSLDYKYERTSQDIGKNYIKHWFLTEYFNEKKKKLKVKTESLLLFSKNVSTVSINKRACFESVENGHEKPLFKRSQTIAVMKATVLRFSERCLLWNSVETPRKISGVVFFLKRLYNWNINFSLKNTPPNFPHRNIDNYFSSFLDFL